MSGKLGASSDDGEDEDSEGHPSQRMVEKALGERGSTRQCGGKRGARGRCGCSAAKGLGGGAVVPPCGWLGSAQGTWSPLEQRGRQDGVRMGSDGRRVSCELPAAIREAARQPLFPPNSFKGAQGPGMSSPIKHNDGESHVGPVSSPDEQNDGKSLGLEMSSPIIKDAGESHTGPEVSSPIKQMMVVWAQ